MHIYRVINHNFVYLFLGIRPGIFHEYIWCIQLIRWKGEDKIIIIISFLFVATKPFGIKGYQQASSLLLE